MKDCGMGCGEEKRAELMEVRRRAARTLLPLGGRDGDNHETLPHTSRVVANAIFSLMPSLVCKTCSLSPHTSRVVANAIFSLMPCLVCKTCSLFSFPPPPSPPLRPGHRSACGGRRGQPRARGGSRLRSHSPCLGGRVASALYFQQCNGVQSGLNGIFFFYFYDGRLF